MQSVRVLARKINPKLAKRVSIPSSYQVNKEVQDANEELKKLYQGEIFTRAQIEQLFREIDSNGDGYLDLDEMAQALRRGRFPTSNEQLKQLFHEIDIKKNGVIDIEEFITFIERRKIKLHEAYDWIMNHRRSVTEKYRGFSASTFRTAAKKSGVNLSDADVRHIMKQLDQNGNNHISYKEFVSYMLMAPDINPKYFLDSWYTEAFSDDAESEYTTPREIRIDNVDDGEPSFTQLVAKKIGCGGLAGTISRTFTAPIDRVRILMMTSAEKMGVRRALATASDGGYINMWKGNGVNCIKIAPEMAVKLLSFDLIKNRIANDPTNISLSERFIAGGMAGVLSQLSIYPLEVVKTRLAIAAGPSHAKSNSNEIVYCIRQTISRGGYRALYAGVGPSVVGIIPYAAIDLSLNSILKEQAAYHLQQAKQETSVPVLLGCGMASSGTATILTFPLNVIRTKAQATGEPLGKVLYELRSQGSSPWRGFYRGLLPCLAKVLPATSISYAAYEYLGGLWDA